MRIIFSCLVLLLVAGGLSPVKAQDTSSIAVVDIQEVLSESKAGKDIQRQVDVQREKFKKELSSKEDSLREEEKKLFANQEDASKEDLEKKKKVFEQKFRDASRDIQKRKKNLDAAFGDAMSKLKKEFYSVVESVAEEKGYHLVLSKQGVIIAQNSFNITQDVIARLDKSVSKISLNVKD